MKQKNIEGELLTYSDAKWQKLYQKYQQKYAQAQSSNVMSEKLGFKEFKAALQAVKKSYDEKDYSGSYSDAEGVRALVKEQNKSMSGHAMLNFREGLRREHSEEEKEVIERFYLQEKISGPTEMNKKQTRALYDLLKEKFAFTSEEWQAYFNS